MVRNFYHTLIFFLSVNFLKAQNDTGFYKNEIGINIGPAVMIALGSNKIYNQPLEVNLKRRINNHFYIKTYFQQKNDYPINESSFLNEINIIDTNRIALTYSSIERWSRAVALGIEYRKNVNKNFGGIFGINLKYKYYKNYIFEFDNIYNSNSLQTIKLNQITDIQAKSGNLTIDKTLGIEPNIGAYFNLGKRFTFISQLRGYFGYGTQHNFIEDYKTWQSSSSKFTVFRIDTAPLISEFSINYKF